MSTKIVELNALDEPHVFETSNGLTFRLKKVPHFAILDVYKKSERLKPPPPVRWNADKERDEPNPNDEAWKREISLIDQDTSDKVANIYLLLGCQLISALPADLEPAESLDWSATLESLEVTVSPPELKQKRYLDWLKLHALAGSDLDNLVQAITEYSRRGSNLPQQPNGTG